MEPALLPAIEELKKWRQVYKDPNFWDGCELDFQEDFGTYFLNPIARLALEVAYEDFLIKVCIRCNPRMMRWEMVDLIDAACQLLTDYPD